MKNLILKVEDSPEKKEGMALKKKKAKKYFSNTKV
tara:strand:+ start:16635 stop:16739 length:105 start_codon:yes stop_codon:yes gene_type:complete